MAKLLPSEADKKMYGGTVAALQAHKKRHEGISIKHKRTFFLISYSRTYLPRTRKDYAYEFKPPSQKKF